MTQKPAMTGSLLLDLCARRLADGYLEVVAQTDSGVFGLGRNQVNALAHNVLPSGFDSQLTESYRNAVIQEVWTDGDTLFVLLDHNRSIVYEYALPGATGAMEAVRFVDDPKTLERIKADLGRDPDAFKISQ